MKAYSVFTGGILRRSALTLVVVSTLVVILAAHVGAEEVYISNFDDFPAYPYNTEEYKENGAFVGCGPTTGAMVFGYFEHVFGLPPYYGLLNYPEPGVDEGLGTARALRGSEYMDTQDDGFGPQLNIKPGMENYAADRGYSVQVLVHVSDSYDSASTAFSEYGDYGDAWMNDGYFWQRFDHLGQEHWRIDPQDFCDFVEEKLSAGVAIFLTIDTNGDREGDHWVPLIGYDRDTLRYAYYDTYSTAVQWADIHGADDLGLPHDNAIAYVRSVRFLGRADVIDNFIYGVWQWVCPDHYSGVYVDLDKDGTYDTMVVFTNLTGLSRVEESTFVGKRYYFSYQQSGMPCPGYFDENRGRFVIHFVDILAPGYDYNDSSTWKFKRVTSLSVDFTHSLSVRPGIPEQAASQSIFAYRNLFQEDPIEGDSIISIDDENYEQSFFGRFEFSDEVGIKEVYVSTDFETNHLDRLILGFTPLEPDIEVSPQSHDFGSEAIGSSSSPTVVTVYNKGTSDLIISDITMSDTTNFTLHVDGGPNPCGSTMPIIMPYESCTVTVEFNPAARWCSGQLTLNSNDPDTPSADVSLSGRGYYQFAELPTFRPFYPWPTIEYELPRFQPYQLAW